VVDGKIYAMGGRATEALTTEYEPATDTWTTRAPMPTSRFLLATSVVNGRIYAIGGGPAAFKPGLSVVEEYDPVTDTWTTKARMPTARWGLSSSVVDGKIYAIGGTGASSFWSGFRRTVEEYDPLTDTWSKKADMPTARILFSTNVVDGKIYAIGGVLGTKACLSTVEAYDPATDTWTTKTPMPTARYAHASAVVDGKIYVIGGGPVGGANHAGPAGLSVVEAYDPATDTWTRKADIPLPRGLLSASAVGGKIYAIGGKTTTKNPHPPGVKTVYEYDTGFMPALITSVNPAGKLPTLWGEIRRNQ
jgi:N-acetylneuraminic acid mutarotase